MVRLYCFDKYTLGSASLAVIRHACNDSVSIIVFRLQAALARFDT